MKIIKPPSLDFLTHKGPMIFLAGSIEMGKAEEWQEAFAKEMGKIRNDSDNYELALLNPRRNDWDSSWEQKMENDKFRDQVNWELECLERADVVAMYFASGTQSPISLLEFGLFAPRITHKKRMVVYCAPDFWRKGNIDIVCKKYGVEQVDSLKALVRRVELMVK